MVRSIIRSARMTRRLCAAAVVFVLMLVVALGIALMPHRRLRQRMARSSARGLSALILAALGIKRITRGPSASRGALLVANHLSWLDVLVALSSWPCTFVAKREVRSWPLIGTLGDAMGVIWIDRARQRDLLRVIAEAESALRNGASLMLFPEGTTTSGHRIRAFRSGLYQAALNVGAPVIPIALSGITASADADALCWYGTETLLENLPRVAALRHARVTVHVGAALAYAPRKRLAVESRQQVLRRYRGVRRERVPRRAAAAAVLQSV